jgi:glycerophosphoryl diester phosphodiesterase
VRLKDALEHLAGRRFRDVGLNVDLKRAGCESALLDELRAAGLLERTIVSCQVPAVLDQVRSREPRARVGISVAGRLARLNHRMRDWRAHVLAGLAAGRWDALMAQHRLIDSQLLEHVVDRGRLLYAWTVNERSAIERLRALGVHGIVTGDPRLFAPYAAARA